MRTRKRTTPSTQHRSQHFTRTQPNNIHTSHTTFKKNTITTTFNNIMMLRLLLVTLLFLGSDALLRGKNHGDDKQTRRKLQMGGGGGSRGDDPCNAVAIEQDFMIFGFSGVELAALTAAAVDNCYDQMNATIRGDECLCYDEAVAFSRMPQLGTGGTRRDLTEQDIAIREAYRELAVIPPGQHCSSNADCTSPELCMVGPYTWVCSTPAGFLGAEPLCDEGDTSCAPLPGGL